MHAHDVDETTSEIKPDDKKSTPRPDPWYKRYPHDYQRGTRRVSLAARGAYSDIIDLIYMEGGPIPDDNRWIACALHITNRQWLKVREELFAKGKLFLREGGIFNKRAEEELAERELTRAPTGSKPRLGTVLRPNFAQKSASFAPKVGPPNGTIPNDINGGTPTEPEADTDLDRKKELASKNPYPIKPEELASLNGSQELIIEQLAKWISPWSPDRETASRTLTTQIVLHGAPVVKQAFGEVKAQIDSGVLVNRPIIVLNKACERIKQAQTKAKVKKPSRW